MNTFFKMSANHRIHNQILLGILLLIALPKTWAFSWQDLWVTKNSQAQTLMNAGQFAKAQEIFEDPAWQATAAYRAGHYQQAATQFQSIKNADAYYNQGNARAKSGQLEAAIKAYDKALDLSPNSPDALHNRDVVKSLIKKQNKSNQNKQDKKNKQEQDKQEQDKQEQDKQEQDKQEQDKQEQDKQEQDKQEQDKQEQDKQEQNKQEQNKQEQDKQEQDKTDKSPQSQSEREQEKKQWLHLIPDDPGGLIREKFRRDYWARHQNQGYE